MNSSPEVVGSTVIREVPAGERIRSSWSLVNDDD
jgi:hypothetical protein